jgi:hypothetical protein
MRMIVERNSQIKTKAEQISPTMEKLLKQCSFTGIPLKKVTPRTFGCSNHMIGNKEMISSIDTSIKSEITLGDDSQVKALGKGSVCSNQTRSKEKHT